MSYLFPTYSSIDEAFNDPINERKRCAGDQFFEKYPDQHRYTQPLHFPNYLSQYSPNYPKPPGPGQNYGYYPRELLEPKPDTPLFNPEKAGSKCATCHYRKNV